MKIKSLILSISLLMSCQPKSEQTSSVQPPLADQLEGKIQTFLNTMTPQEKVGQVLILGLRPPLYPYTVTKSDPQIQTLLKEIQPGGITFFKGNFLTGSQTSSMIRDLDAKLKIKAFFAVDEEGGLVSRLGSNPKMNVPRLDEAQTLAKSGEDGVEKAYSNLSTAMRALGLNMNLAPVGDGDFVPGNPLGNRAFSKDVAQVSLFSLRAIKGIQDAGISAVIKHFPGLDSVTMDPHQDMPVLSSDELTLESRDLRPFKDAAAAGVDAIMAAHVILPQVTGNKIPAGFSPVLLKTLIRDKWKYQGLIISDGLEMAAITKRWSPEESAVMALEAGSDMLLLPLEPGKVKKAILKALESGRLKWKDLDESLMRILRTKARRGVITLP